MKIVYRCTTDERYEDARSCSRASCPKSHQYDNFCTAYVEVPKKLYRAQMRALKSFLELRAMAYNCQISRDVVDSALANLAKVRKQ